MLKTGLLSFALFTTCCLAPTRCNRFTYRATTSASTANFSSKGFYHTQNVSVALRAEQFAKQIKEKPLHQDRHAKQEGRPFYPKCFLLSGNRNNPKNITARHEFSVLGVRKRFPLGAKQHLQSNKLPCAPDGQQTGKEEIRAKRATLSTHLCNARTSKCSEKIPAGDPLSTGASQVLLGTKSVVTRPLKPTCLGTAQHTLTHKQSIALGGRCKATRQGTGIKLLDTTPCSDLPARLVESFSVHRTGRRVFERSLLPEKFINLLMANGEKDKARRCLTQALFSITTHCQKHNLQNNSPLKIFTDSFFKQESAESKGSTADNSLKRANLATVQQKTRTNELLPPLPKGKSNTLLYMQSNLHSKRDANPGKSSNVLRDVGLVLLESRLDNLSNGRYSGTKKRKLYPSVKESQGLLSMAKGTSIFRLNHIERVEKRLLSKQNGKFFLFVKQKGKLVGVGSQIASQIASPLASHVAVEKQTGKFKIPLSLPFCGKSFQTTFPVSSFRAKQNNFFLSLIRLSLKEKFLISEKGFASLALHKKVQQSYLCSAPLHLVRTKGNKKRYQTLQIHFLPFLPYSTPFNWRGKGLNPLFGFAKQSQRFLLELCKASANRSVKGTEKVRQNNPFGSFPLLSCFYSAHTFSSPFSQDEYVQQDTKLETKGLDKFIALLLQTSVAKQVGEQFAKQHKQPPQNDSHSNTKDQKDFHCFTQGIFPLAKRVVSQEKDTKSVHTGVLVKGIQRVQPTLEVRRVRKGRNTFQVPSVVKQKRGEKVGIKWIIDSARRSKRKGNKLFSDSLANQLVQSFDRLGEARSKRNELLKLAESNRPFLRFRWW